MKTRYIIALALTVLLLAVARRMSTRHVETFETESGGIAMLHRTVTESFNDGPRLEVSLSETDRVRGIALYSQFAGGPYESLEMNSEPNGFSGTLPVLEKGKRWYYHIDIYRDNIKLATFPPERDQFIKFKGDVSLFVLIPHIFFMFATIFFGIMAVFTAVDYSRGRGDVSRAVRFLFLALISALLGGFIFGPLVTYQTFGEGWGGWPVGNDWTDTKTEIFFLFWLVTFILSWKGMRGEPIRITPKLYSFLVILSFAVTLITFLIPHSI